MSEAGERLRQQAYGHPELWDCSLNEFIGKVVQVLQAHQVKNKLQKKVVVTTSQFLRIKFDKKEL